MTPGAIALVQEDADEASAEVVFITRDRLQVAARVHGAFELTNKSGHVVCPWVCKNRKEHLSIDTHVSH